MNPKQSQQLSCMWLEFPWVFSWCNLQDQIPQFIDFPASAGYYVEPKAPVVTIRKHELKEILMHKQNTILPRMARPIIQEVRKRSFNF